MKIGAVFPQTEIGNDPQLIRDWAQTAEGLGYADILVYDHVIGAVHEARNPTLMGPYSEESPFHEVFVLLGYLAAVTSQIELVTGVLILPQRQTALVAKQAAEVAVLSGERLRLGVGVGWNYVEYGALGQDFHIRGRFQEEQVDLLRRLWSTPVVDYTGQWHRVDRAGILPRPRRPIPIWFGGFSDVTYRRAAQLGDGLIVSGGSPSTPTAFGAATMSHALMGVERTRRFLAEMGRDEATFGFEFLLNWQEGSANWRRDVESVRNAGIHFATMRSMNAGLKGAEHITALETWADGVR